MSLSQLQCLWSLILLLLQTHIAWLMFSGTETMCVCDIRMIITMTIVKNILHFIMETYKKLEYVLCLKMHHAIKM